MRNRVPKNKIPYEETVNRLVYELSIYNQTWEEEPAIKTCSNCKTVFNFIDRDYDYCPFCKSDSIISS